ncbi:TLD domain-containing protein 2-like isoform X9 [Dinothrombium tinctorium]|uniref:Oxidation resistance protein 1 n=1 Tax=Dinothrombium tinctorium TaxID=1965070 RepID=A0A443QUL8_9ACAR|nr:TLD domain-containing protein 2-like isoform X9 [Dinothrombium tinctorium]
MRPSQSDHLDVKLNRRATSPTSHLSAEQSNVEKRPLARALTQPTHGSYDHYMVVSMNDAQRPFQELSELPLPELLGTSEVLTEERRRCLVEHLPARAEGYAWKLIYSTSKHGFSLNTLYREMAKYESPVLLIIQDTCDTVFGALTSCPIRMSEHFYGTGETFVFTFNPEFLCFHWTGDNQFFIKGNADSLIIGAGDGLFGLWLDGDLYRGRSQSCNTFANTRLSSHEDFVVKALECWTFV